MNKDVRQGQALFELLMRQFRAPRKLRNVPYLHGGKHSSGGPYWQKKKRKKKNRVQSQSFTRTQWETSDAVLIIWEHQQWRSPMLKADLDTSFAQQRPSCTERSHTRTSTDISSSFWLCTIFHNQSLPASTPFSTDVADTRTPRSASTFSELSVNANCAGVSCPPGRLLCNLQKYH